MADVKVTVAPAGARLKAVSIPGPPGPEGPQGPKGDDGESGTGSVTATPDTLVQRDGSGSIKAAAIEAASLTSVAAPPSTGQPGSPALGNGGALDPTKTFHYLLQYFWQNGQQYNFPEVTVVMNGHTSTAFNIPSLPQPPNSPMLYAILNRTDTPGDYSSPDTSGVVTYYAFNGADSYPIVLTDIGDPFAFASSIGNSTTIPFVLANTGMVHSGQITGAKLVATDAVPSDSNDSTLVPSSWVMAKIAALQAQIDALTPH